MTQWAGESKRLMHTSETPLEHARTPHTHAHLTHAHLTLTHTPHTHTSHTHTSHLTHTHLAQQTEESERLLLHHVLHDELVVVHIQRQEVGPETDAETQPG